MANKFEDVKVGDKVIYTAGPSWNSYECIGEVVKVTAKQFEIKSGSKFRKEDGKLLGGDYRHCRYATQEDVNRIQEKIKRNKLRNKIISFCGDYTKVDKMSTEDLETVWSIISKYTENK